MCSVFPHLLIYEVFLEKFMKIGYRGVLFQGYYSLTKMKQNI